MKKVTLLTLLLILSAAVQVQAQNSRWLPDFAFPGLRRKVLTLGTYGDDLIAGGTPLESREGFHGHIARFDGHHWHPLGDNPAMRVTDTVFAVQEFQGDLIVGGAFLGAGGQTSLHIARWDGADWHPMGNGIGTGQDTPTILDMAVFQNELYIAGSFSNADGLNANSIVKWDGANFALVGSGVTHAQGQQATVRVLHATPTKLYVGGNFERAGGLTVKHLASWDGSSWENVGGGTSTFGTIASINTFQGDLHVGGTFNFMTGSSLEFNHIARWDGSMWHDLDGGLPDGTNGVEVNSLEVYGGHLYASGNFNYAGGDLSSGILTPRLARWDGSAWSATGGLWSTDGNEQDWPTTQWDGRLVIGGRLSYAGASVDPDTQIVSGGLAGFDGSDWSTIGKGLGIEGTVKVVVPYNGGWAVCGAFQNAGERRHQNIVFWDGGAWTPLASTDGSIDAAIVHQGNLIVTGNFSQIDGQAVSGVASFDGNNWTQLGNTAAGLTFEVHLGELYLGGLGSPKRFDGSQWISVGPQLFGYTQDLHSHGGLLWIGGLIGEFAGPGPYLLTWDGTNMTPVGPPNHRVSRMETFEGDLIIGGEFTSVGGVACNGVARWNGSSFQPMGNGLGGGGVFAFEQAEGELYAAGSFTPFFGAPNGFVARWNGTQWKSLADGLDNAPLDMAYDAGSRLLYLGGGPFQVAGDMPCRAFAAWRVGDEPFRVLCEASTTGCPCGGGGSGAGCPNGATSGAALEAQGFNSLTSGSLTLETSGLPAGVTAVLFTSTLETASPILLGNGMRCVSNPIRLSPITSASAQGVIVREGVIQSMQAASGMSVTAGSSWYLQDWYRDPQGACGGGMNTSNAVEVTFAP